MVTSLSAKARTIIVATFAVGAFSAAGFGSYMAGQYSVSADTPVPSPSIAAVAMITGSVTEGSTTAQDATATAADAPDTTIDPATASVPADSEPNPTAVDQPLTTDNPATAVDITATLQTEVAPPKPFYQDMRYLILIADAILVLGMIMMLTFRLVNRVVPGTPIDPSETGGRDKPITVDELNMDIPL